MLFIRCSAAWLAICVLCPLNAIAAEDHQSGTASSNDVALAEGWASLSPAPISLDFSIIPRNDVPPEYKGYLGVWGGRWEGTLDTCLVINEIIMPEARLSYSLGTNLLVRQPVKIATVGRLRDGRLIVYIDQNSSMEITLWGNGQLFGVYKNNKIDHPSRVWFSSIQSTDPALAANTPPAVGWSGGCDLVRKNPGVISSDKP